MRSGDVEETQRCPCFKPLPCTPHLSQEAELVPFCIIKTTVTGR